VRSPSESRLPLRPHSAPTKPQREADNKNHESIRTGGIERVPQPNGIRPVSCLAPVLHCETKGEDGQDHQNSSSHEGAS